jgi:3-methyladenine DNA glycosylase/8-oxoguanine DNA glycosylase
MKPDASGNWPIPEPYDFHATTDLLRTGLRDPTLRREHDGFWRTAHTAGGPATVRVTVGDTLRADAWGPGAAAAITDVPRWLGLHEAPWELTPHPVVDRLLRQYRGLRSTDTRDVFEALVTFVLQQLVTWNEAVMTWRVLCERLGQRAPGPAGLRLSPTPRAIFEAGTTHLQAAGIGPRQARTLIEISRVAHALRRAADLPTQDAANLMQKVRGIGPWTASMALGLRLGRPEPIPVGDVHLPHTIAWALAGEPRANDGRMLQLLEPFGGQGFRVIRLVYAAGIQAPKRGPRHGWRRPPPA